MRLVYLNTTNEEEAKIINVDKIHDIHLYKNGDVLIFFGPAGDEDTTELEGEQARTFWAQAVANSEGVDQRP